MKALACVIAFAVLSPAQQPAIENARLESRPLTGTIAAELARAGSGPFWAGWSEPILAGQHHELCSWNDNGGGGRVPGTPLRLEGEVALVVLVRVEAGQPGELRVSSPDCHLDAGGLPFYWLNSVPVGESLAWLRSLAEGPRGDTAIMAISLHQGAAADRELDELAAVTQPTEVRKRTAFWLGSSRGASGIATLKRMLADDPASDVRGRVVFALSQSRVPGGVALVVGAARSDRDPLIRGQALFWLARKAAAQVSADAVQNTLTNDPDGSVRERAVFALTQLPNGQGVPLLIELARTHRDPAVRKKAMFWLGQSKDPRALDFFARTLKP